jgi:serine/threonine protein kinase
VRAGQRIGKYVLDERIAVGGMAEVWAARAEGPQGFVKSVALKFILESFAGDPELERLFVNEARIAAQLQHANLVTVFDFDKIGADQEPGLAGRYYIAMERVEGNDLRRLAEAAKRAGYLFPIGIALHLAGEVLKALRYVHERRDHGRALDLVHRDVSPHNVLVGYSGEVKLSDFGIAKARVHSARGTKTGNVRGKLAYASPEQLNGETVDHRTDQFALGVTLWEILAGRRLFEGRDELETVGKVVRCAVPRLADSTGGRAVPPGVEAVVRRMLSPRRDDRYQTTGDALSAVLGLSSYLADGTALGDLVRTLFMPSAVDLPPTMPIQAVPLLPQAPAEAVRLAETRTMQKPSARAAGAATPRVAAPTPATLRAAGRTPGSASFTRPELGAGGSRGTTAEMIPRNAWPRVVLLGGTLAVAAVAALMVVRRMGSEPARPPAAPAVESHAAIAPPALVPASSRGGPVVAPPPAVTEEQRPPSVPRGAPRPARHPAIAPPAAAPAPVAASAPAVAPAPIAHPAAPAPVSPPPSASPPERARLPVSRANGAPILE